MVPSSNNYTASYIMLTEWRSGILYSINILFFGSLITSVLLLLCSVVADSEKNKLRYHLQNTT